MSDAVLIALITGPLAIVVTHVLGRRDRALASETVKAKDRELEELKAVHRQDEDAWDQERSMLRRQLYELGVTPWSPA